MKLKLITTLLLMTLSLTARAGNVSQEIDVTWTQREANGVTQFEIKPKAMRRVIKLQQEKTKIRILVDGKRQWLDLKKFKPFAYEHNSVHYVGSVRGIPDSLAELSIFDNRLSGFILFNGKKHEINSAGLRAKVVPVKSLPTTNFGHDAIEHNENDKAHPAAQIMPTAQNTQLPVIKVNYEIDHQMFISSGRNAQTARAILESVLPMVSAIYLRDGITIQASGIRVWDTPDPYSNYTPGAINTSSSVLSGFAQQAVTPLGSNLSHLVTMRPGFGGIAYLRGLCSSSSDKGVSSIGNQTTHSEIYSWSVNVIAHELGHNLNSPHTHDCSWTVNGVANQAIDGCSSPGGTCARPAIPPGFKGTIMSYCHTNSSIGVDMRLGFGPLPSERMRQYILQSQQSGCFSNTDTRRPAIAWISPSNLTINTVLSGVVPFVIDAIDNDRIAVLSYKLYSGAGGWESDRFYVPINPDNNRRYTINIDTRTLKDDTYWLDIVPQDPAGLTSTNRRIFRVVNTPDSTPPRIDNIVLPAANQVLSGTQVLDASVSDNVGVDAVEFWHNGSNLGRATASSVFSRWNLSIDTRNLPNGAADFYVRARDFRGNWGESSRVRATVQNTQTQPDTMTPVIRQLDLVSNSDVRAPVVLRAAAYDNVGVTRVEWQNFLGTIGTDTTSPYEMTLDTSGLTVNSPLSIRAIAYDAAGNVSATGSVPLNFIAGGNPPPPPPPADTTAPVIAVSSPVNNASIVGTINIAATATDNVAVTRMEVSYQGSVVRTSTSGSISHSIPTTHLDNGSKTIIVRAFDAANNQSSITRTITVNNVVPDTIAPVIAVSFPVEGASIVGDVVISATATDNVAVTRMEVSYQGAIVSLSTSGVISHTIPTTHLDNGAKVIVVMAFDAAGNQSSVTRNITVNNVVPDKENPVVIVSSPVIGSQIVGDIVMTATATDNKEVAKMELWLDGVKVKDSLTGSISHTVATAFADNGTKTLIARAWDASDNMGEVSINFSVNNPAPPPEPKFELVGFTAKQDLCERSGQENYVDVLLKDLVGDPQVRQKRSVNTTWSTRPKGTNGWRPIAGGIRVYHSVFNDTVDLQITCTACAGTVKPMVQIQWRSLP